MSIIIPSIAEHVEAPLSTLGTPIPLQLAVVAHDPSFTIPSANKLAVSR